MIAAPGADGGALTPARSAFVWLAVPALAIVFFLATHDPFASLQWQRTLPGEVASLVGDISAGRMQRWIAFPALAAFGALGALLHRRRPADSMYGPLAILLASLLVWCTLSLGWSGEPGFTARRLVVLYLLVAGATGIVRQLTLRDAVRAITACAALFLLAGIAVEMALGTFHPLAAWYRFAGTQHPNQQGINCAILLLGSTWLAASERGRTRRLAVALAVLALGFLVLTRSRTAFASGVASTVVLVMMVSSRPRAFAVGLGSAWAAGVLYLLFTNGLLPAPWRALLLGRDASHLATLTGRTEIWALSLEQAAERPFLGYGYGTFWTPGRTAEISNAVQWTISEGHSAYIDVLLTLGIAGALLFMTLLAVAIWRSAVMHRRTRDPVYALATAFFLFAALDGILESAVTIPNFLSFTLFVLLGSLAFGIPPRLPHRPAEPHPSAPMREFAGV